MFRKFIHLLIVLTFSFAGAIKAQTFQKQLNWKHANEQVYFFTPNATGLYFDGCIVDDQDGLPLFASRFELNGDYSAYTAKLSQKVFTSLTAEEKALLPEFFHPDTKISFLRNELVYIRKKPSMFISFLPFRINAVTGEIEKLISFSIQFTAEGSPRLKSLRAYSEESVLANGNWLKITTREAGVYKITYEELSAAGFSLQGLHPGKIKLYGNGGAMLPEQNDLPRIDDLREVAIKVVAANPDAFAPGDHILFYAPSPHTWHPLTTGNSLRFEFTKNIYSDYAYYFVTIAHEADGKRIQSLPQSTQFATHQVNTFHDYAIYKPDIVNLAKVGRQWFGEKMHGSSPPIELTVFEFPNIDPTHRVLVRGRFAVKATEMSRVQIIVNEFDIPGSLVAVPNTHTYANISSITSIFHTNNPVFNVSVEYLNSNPSAAAWVDFVEFNLKRQLIYTNGQFAFRDLSTVGDFYISNFRLRNPVEGLRIWEITDFGEPKQIDYSLVNNVIEFKLPTPVLREFITFTIDDAYSVLNIEPVANQNLHGLSPVDMVIVSPGVFMSAAEEYAAFRRESSDLSIGVVQLEHIYNEFASGSPDPTAIRDFMKMLYDRATPGQEPRYLLLFGDGSYDPKDRITNNNNFIPTYQSVESLRQDVTYVTDDYFGLLDDGEGHMAAGGLDIGIGRLPVNSLEQAAIMQGKIEHYLLNHESTSGAWRSRVTIIAHDEDNDVHFVQAEELSAYIDTNHSVFSLDKIYLDAYQRVNIPSGYRYPDVNEAINNRVNDGSLLINYIGHGGETGWAHSKVLTISDINSWQNYDNMPVFLTATCSFGRFDNPEMVSAGEMVVLNPRGGAIALFTTSRLAYSSFNQRLNRSFTRFFFERPGGRISSLGEIMMKSKNDNDNIQFIRNFVLLGDPSMKPAIPEYNVITTQINGNSPEATPTLLGMTKVTVSGYVGDHNHNKMSGFNGILHPVVYDKTSRNMTNANHHSSTPRPFYLQDEVLYTGKVSVVDGEFTFSFVVPRGVNPAIGPGKISYYATNGEVDAHGFSDDFMIGGLDPNITDNSGPQIEMYINDPVFQFGDPTNENPLMIAHLSDESGINFFGLGIGHEIIAFLNEDTQNPILLNDYYEPDLDSHTSGKVTYRFNRLPEGRHSLRLRAFDLNNNSAEAYTEFVVTSRLELAAGDLRSYPNPSFGGVYFALNHNYYDQVVNIVIDIYDLKGMNVRTIGPLNVQSYGSEIEPVYWDGSNHTGHPVGAGVYIYTVRLETSNDFSSLLNGKLMIIR